MATKTKNRPPSQDDPNRIQDDYDQKFNDTDQTFNEMTSPENYDRDGVEPEPANDQAADGEPSLHERESQPDKNEKDLSGAEAAERQQVDGGEDFAYQPDDGQKKSAKSQVAGAFAGKRKYGWIGGGIFVTFLSILAIIAPTLGPLHIFHNFFNHNFEMNDSFRRQRTSRIVKSIFRANADTNRPLADTPFKLKADLIAFEKYEARMQSRGWGIEYDGNNKPIGLIDPDGAFVNLDNLSPAEFARQIDPMLKDTIPAWQMTKRVQTRSLISTFSGPRRSFRWTDLFSREARNTEENFTKRKVLKETGLDNFDLDPDAPTQGVDTDGDGLPDVDGDGNTVTGGEFDELSDSQQAFFDALDEGQTKSAALGRATEVGISSNPTASGRGAAITTVALVAGCLAHAAYEDDLVATFSRYSSALRVGATYLLGVNEMQQGGDIDVGEVGQLFSEFNNDEGSFASSAAYQRATGSPVVGPELDHELHVVEQPESENFIETSFESIGMIVSALPFSNIICGIVNSVFFAVLGTIIDVAETVAVCVGSVGTACAIAVGKYVAFEALFEFAGRMIAASITNTIGLITDNPVQSGALLDQSLSLIASEETRTASAVDDTTYNQAVAQFKRDTVQNLPFAQRYFDISNSGSITHAIAESKLAISESSPKSLLASLFALPATTVAMAASSNSVYAQDLAFDNYDIQKYMFDSAYLEVDAYEHAESVMAEIESDDGVVSSAGGISGSSDLSRDFAVLCMGFDPATNSVNKLASTSMLPMFSDPETLGAAEATRRNELFTALCVEAASSDTHSELYARVGRFVDDLELVQSIQEMSELLEPQL